MTEPLAHRRQFALDSIAGAALNRDDVDTVTGIRCLVGVRGVDVAVEAAGAPDTPRHDAAVARTGAG